MLSPSVIFNLGPAEVCSPAIIVTKIYRLLLTISVCTFT